MGVAAYKYFDDGGRVWQVYLPDDFASVLGYQAAAGTEAYLPFSLSPRFLTYVSRTTGQWASAVVGTRATFAAPPQAVSVGGTLYQLVSANGEAFGVIPGGNIQVIAGPQGQKGDAGTPAPTITTYSQTLGADVALTVANQVYIPLSQTVPAGTYLVLATIQCQNGASAGRFGSQLVKDSIGLVLASGSTYIATANQWLENNHNCIITLAASDTISLRGYFSATGANVRYTNGDSQAPATRLDLVKLL